MLITQSCLTLCDPMDCIAYQVPLSVEFSRPEYWSGLPFPSPGDLCNPGIKPRSPALQADSLLLAPLGSPEQCLCVCVSHSVVSDSLRPLDCSPPGSSVHGIFRQEYWTGLPFPSSGDLPDPGIKPTSLVSPGMAGESFTTAPPGKLSSTEWVLTKK